MRISRIVKDKECYGLLCRFTLEDIELLPEKPTKANLMDLELPIENMTSSRGFWFHPCSVIHWIGRSHRLTPPPSAEDA